MQQETTQNFGAPLSDTFDNYFSEIENKYRPSESRLQTNKTPGLIIGASAIAVAIFLGGLIWLFTRERSTPVEAITENKPPVIEKSKSNTPPDGMVYVAGREFMMGDDGADEYARPAHRVSVKPFYIDKTEVTCEEYKKFVDATGHPSPLTWQNNNFPAGSAEKPVTGVNWDDAVAFARWKNKRLPSEEEWEFAARGTDGRIYPWGNEWKPEATNAANRHDGVQPVGTSGGQSPFGVFDMSGNAWEWTASDARGYPNGKPFETKSIDAKVIRGGFFGSPKEGATTVYRGAWGARGEKDYKNTGFRCAEDVP